MYVPAWPPLLASELRPPRVPPPFPLSVPDALHFYRARNAIYHLFRALGVGPDDTVLVPDYHSGNEVAAIRAAGAGIRFYRIGSDLQPDLDEVEALCRRGARALLVIHFMGWPQPIAALARLARAHDVVLVEDCALALLSSVAGRPLGTFGDFAVFCLYKTLPLPNGAVLVQNGRRLPGLAGLRLRPCDPLSLLARLTELDLTGFRCRWHGAGAALVRLKRAGGRLLTAAGAGRVPVGEIGFDPTATDLAMSAVARWLCAGLDHGAILRRRRENYHRLLAQLPGDARPLGGPLDEGTCPLFFPLLVADKAAAARALARDGVETIEFWNTGDPAAEGPSHAAATALRRHVLEVPIHQAVTPRQIDRIAGAIARLTAWDAAGLAGPAPGARV